MISLEKTKFKIKSFSGRVLDSKIFIDSFWAIFGNGLGSALFLFAGIIIARLLGKDLYGEYGVVKTTMFYAASFATFGISFTSTKYIAQYIKNETKFIKSIIRDSLAITIGFSAIVALFLALFSEPLANYVNEPGLKVAFQALAVIIIFKAVATTQIGILAGLKYFDKSARNNVISGLVMLGLSIPFTYFYGLLGALLSLASSQVLISIMNQIIINQYIKQLSNQSNKNFIRELIVFSTPVALQESSFAICNWAAVLFLTKFSSAGELGLYSVAAQWNAIIMMIPSLLSNVVLSHLSSAPTGSKHDSMLKKMLMVNFLSTIIPFLIVLACASIISGLYGATFHDMPAVLRVIAVVPVFESLASVYKSDFLAIGKTWVLFSLRLCRDAVLLICVYFLLLHYKGQNGALLFSYATVLATILFYFAVSITHKLLKQKTDV